MMSVPSPCVFAMSCRSLIAAFTWLLVLVGFTHAQTGGSRPLSELLDVSPEIALNDIEAIRQKAREQLASGLLNYRSTPTVPTPPPPPGTVTETVTFEGFIESTGVKLAIFSDDGCSVYINGQLIHERAGVGQHLPDLSQSFYVLHNSVMATQPYHMRVVYTNTIYGGSLDIDGATLFAWGGQIFPTPGRLYSLTATEVHGTTSTSNSLTVTSVTDETLFICDGNKVRLSTDNNTPGAGTPLGRVLFTATGTGVSPSSGTFQSGSPTLTIPSDIMAIVKAGTDVNGNGLLDAEEVTQGLRIRTARLGSAAVHAQRTSAPAESLFPMHPDGGEHFDIGSTFQFVLVPAGNSTLGSHAMLKHELWDTEGFDSRVTSGVGAALTWTMVLNTDFERGMVRYYLDSDDDGYSWYESHIDSPEFVIMLRKRYDIKSDVSSNLPAGAAAAIPVLLAAATDILLTKDSADDYRACVTLRSEAVTTFTATPTGGARPDPVNVQTDSNGNIIANSDLLNHYNAPADIVFVNAITNANNFSYTGLTGGNDWHKIIIVYTGITATNAQTIAHEFGHGVGLEHDGHSSGHVMYGFSGAANNELLKEDVDNYDGGP